MTRKKDTARLILILLSVMVIAGLYLYAWFKVPCDSLRDYMPWSQAPARCIGK